MTIVFYGPIGGKKGTIIGGGESGNNKTISILEQLGFNVKIIEKPYPIGNKFFRSIAYPFQLLGVYFIFLYSIVFDKKITFHLSGFYNHLIYFEFLYIITAKLFNIKSVYEIRAGGAIEIYMENSNIYRFFFRKTMQNATNVLCQGREYVPFLKTHMNVDGLYYPNFIQDELFGPYSDNERNNEKKVKIVYFGRIVPSKNIEFIIDICKNLKGLNFSCEIIGAGEKKYITILNRLIDDFGMSENVIISRPISTSDLKVKLNEKHFFLFPSREKREGQSNSLTEAMSFGVVPLVSTAGFNASIVNNSFLVVEKFDCKIYAERIISICESKKWSSLSQECYSIVANNFTENSVRSVLEYVHKR